jgi:twinkle protein
MAKDSSSQQAMDDRTATWVKNARAISRETLKRLGVGSGTAYFPELQAQSAGVFFPYETGWKARAIPKKAFVSKPDTKVTFWGLREVLAGPLDKVYIVEGEFDRCAMVEAGIDPGRVLAAPGASGDKDTELQYANEALAAGLYRVKKFVLVTDNDEAGRGLREALAQCLGVARSWFVDLPEGVKDVNDFLRSDGPRALHELVEERAVEWPSFGLYTLDDLPEPPQLRRWATGIEEWKERVYLATGTLSVATGHPGHGKTHLSAQLWYNIVRNYDLKACIATFETRPRPHYHRMLRQFYGGQLDPVSQS